MVYEWDPHKDVLYRLYIQERKHLETEIIPYMRDNHNFNPSKRAYQTQFKRWNFPSKQNPAHRNLDLVGRVKELWEQNCSQRDMLGILNDEGYNLKERELMRLRAKHRWLLRVPNGMKSTAKTPQFQQEPLAAANENEDDPSKLHLNDEKGPAFAMFIVPPPEEAARKRKERQDELQAWSDERWAAKKRRRRTRGYAGMGADPPGPPRFPSETTLDESKQFLSLDDKSYRRIRDLFQTICEEESIIKKTLAGPEKWQAAKDRLIQDDSHLQTVFWAGNTNLEAKALALDIVCLDVTKRMRTADRSMTIAEAKNTLGVNPEQGRQVRNSFYAILKANHFTSKTEAGKDLWQQMKRQWIEGSRFLQEAASPTDPQHTLKTKALDVLCRDVMKRLRDDIARQSSATEDPGDNSLINTEHSSAIQQSSRVLDSPAANSGLRLTTSTPNRPPHRASNTTNLTTDLQIDPNLLEAAGDISSSSPSPVAVYVRPHPKSEIYQSTKMWLGTLSLRTVFELHTLLASKWPDAISMRVDGLEKAANGQEISYLIEEDEELDAYLDHVQGRKAVFVVMLKKL